MWHTGIGLAWCIVVVHSYDWSTWIVEAIGGYLSFFFLSFEIFIYLQVFKFNKLEAGPFTSV
ncbi:hypothetical protein HanRHA438_Chr01g0034111 [Helianthus annuus]|nr:hypothetical protein HanRHA438_Chr01g0034111 [Helianthus annuus]